MRTLIVGHGGREAALAMRMAEHSELHAFLGHENPTVVRHAAGSGGAHRLGDVCDPQAVAAFAREQAIDIAMVSADEPLQAGVVDALLAQGTRTVGPTSAGAEIEWNKAFARSLLAEVAPESMPLLRIVREKREAAAAIASFGSRPVVVKPSGLTGGKGVKVMGPHLASHEDALEYALELLERGAGEASVLIEEKILGAEFTIQAISDGRTVLFPPATYDYPYRFDGDEGPGTGGMGSLSMASPTLPFMTAAHYEQACSIVAQVIERLSAQGRHFNGIMNSGFFATPEGVKVIEFNARFGDPECMNIMSLLRGSWPEVMQRIAGGTLAEGDLDLREEASLVLYLVSPDYALGAGRAGSAGGAGGSGGTAPVPYEFTLDREQIEGAGCHAFFSSAVALAENTYRTVGTSRAVALATTAPTLEQAHARIVEQAASIPVLQWRHDVGDIAYMSGLSRLLQAREPSGEEPLLRNAI